MVTAYYIMKMTKNNKHFDTDEYFSNLYNEPHPKIFHKKKSKCRVCLKHGTISIFDNENAAGIVEALKIFANIELKEDDINLKSLCNICYKFINSAIMFRKIAQQTNDTLKKHIERLSNFVCGDDNDSFNENDSQLVNNENRIGYNSFIQTVEEKERKDIKVQCQTCKKTIRKSYYKIHMTMHDPDHHKYICDICGKTFRLRVGYHNHRLRHRTDYPYKCQFCPFKGRYSERLKSHMRTHSGEYRYMCTECPARFLFKGNFNSHVLLKHKEPQYKCDRCEKLFHTKLKLQRHNEVNHLGIKSHICNICGRAFGYRNAMMKHQRRVHKREKLRFSHKPSHVDNNNVS